MSYRIAIIGTSGCGKTTLAQQVADVLVIPHIELDALFWKPNWEPSGTWEFIDRIEAATQQDSWVVDGNYQRARWVLWERATTVIWLNYVLPLVLWRVTCRTVRRSLQQQELWHGCYETLHKGFFSRDSIILWALKTYYRHQRTYQPWFALPYYRQLRMIELRSPTETADWLASLPNSLN